MKFYPDKEYTRSDVTDWCNNNSTLRNEVFEKVLGKLDLKEVEALFPQIFEEAQKKADDCQIFMGGPGDLTLLYHLSKQSKTQYAIETGVAFGWSSLAILLGIKDQDSSKLISIDMPYVQGNNEPYVGSIVPEALRKNWTLLRQADRQGLPKALKMVPYLDLCHYDSDKSYYGRRWAYPKLWEALKTGGIFISDDIQDNWAFKEFCEDVNRKPQIVEFDTKYVGIIQK
ncbi:MAG: class I SAM-dependent methyltransferase [Bacteroidota bacterium]